ncbi:MAG: VOC family protein [Phycisphaerae bacterium]|nr:VOC family protein [Phycisphaerae bacterium]
MPLRTVPVAPGMFCWFELTTRDVPNGSVFYREVLSAAAADAEAATQGVPLGHADATGRPIREYILFNVAGHAVAGLNPMDDAFPSDAASHWLPYIAVEDVDGVCTRVQSLGGCVSCGPSDIAIGRFAVVRDPTGGVFALFCPRPGATDGTSPVGPGAFVWCELVTRDVAVASEFYAKLLGWTPQFCRLGATSYIEMKAGARPVASVFEACADEDRSPAHWCPYLCVADIERALAAAVRHGGQKLCEPMTLPGDGPASGRYAGVTDPTGAHVALIELKHS